MRQLVAAHTSAAMMVYLVQGSFKMIVHLPYSPDLVPCDKKYHNNLIAS